MKTFVQQILLGMVIAMVAACDRPESAVREERASDTPAQPLRYHALLIGIGDYSGTGWPALGTARDDAEALGDILKSQYGFQVTELLDKQATRGDILRALDGFMDLTPQDALLIYFAGHGYYDKQMDEGYWIPHGAHKERMGRPAKEDWLWNSSISRVLEASPAKHVLLIADTCYGGSLFRGTPAERDKSDRWYQRAMNVPSRYLITSGNLEPVLDSGIRHSVFAQQILNYLEYADHSVFSASDIGVAIRTQVSELTGQLVRMGPMATPAHAGGEFVFVRNGDANSNAALPEQSKPVPETPVYRNAGVRTVADNLTQRVGTYARETMESSFVRPRILACLGPTGDDDAEAAIVRSRIQKNLETIGGCILVEREALDAILHEMELGQSAMADQRATMEIGKLLPASLILLGEIIPFGNGTEIHLRVIDTETSRVLSSSTATYESPSEVDSACEALAREAMETMNRARPLLLSAQPTDNGMLSAGWGRFHGARIGDRFSIIALDGAGTVSQRDIPLGTATIASLKEESAEFKPDWTTTPDPAVSLWLKANP